MENHGVQLQVHELVRVLGKIRMQLQTVSPFLRREELIKKQKDVLQNIHELLEENGF